MVGIRIHVIHYLVATPSLQQREEPYQVDAVPLPHIPNTIRDSISVKCIRISTSSERVCEFCYWVFNLFLLGYM